MTMLAVLTPWGLAIWRNGTSAPLWRALVTPFNTAWVNWFAALAVASCLVYVVHKLVFPHHRHHRESLANPLVKLAILFSILPLFVLPPLAKHIVELSPFYFALVPCALSLVLMVAQIDRSTREYEDGEESYKHLNMLLLLSAGCSAVGAWESLMGVPLAVALLCSTLFPKIRHKRSISLMLFLWLIGFFTAFVAEGICLGWPWGAFRPFRVPTVGMVLFGLVSVLPLAMARTLGVKRWLICGWGAVLAILLANVLVRGVYWRPGATESFVRAVLADLNDRELIIGDGMTDEFFRVLKPYEVRLVGTRKFEDREFLISFFGKDEPVAERAVVVRQYYHLPEAAGMMAENGVRLTKQGKAMLEADRLQALSPAVWEMKHRQAVTNQMYRLLALSGPVVKSVKEMLDHYEEIPVNARRKKVEEARANIHKGWLVGMAGPTLSSTILSLDVLLNDWEAAESDALTALTIDRDDPAANTMLGSLRLRKREYPAAEKYLRKGARGGGSAAYNDYAIVLLRTGRAAKAEEWSRLAVRKSPKDWNYRETLVQVLTTLKMSEDAMHELQQAERLAKEAGQYDLVKDVLTQDRNNILRLRSVSSQKWGE